MRRSAMSDGAQPATPFSRIAPALAGWIIIAASLGVAAILFTSRPQEAIGQTGPALGPSGRDTDSDGDGDADAAFE